jgi:hypothetical protein
MRHRKLLRDTESPTEPAGPEAPTFSEADEKVLASSGRACVFGNPINERLTSVQYEFLLRNSDAIHLGKRRREAAAVSGWLTDHIVEGAPRPLPDSRRFRPPPSAG